MKFNDLPLYGFKQDFFNKLSSSPLLIEAEPGAGKSTLIPLWLLEKNPAGKQIWLIQPRILAAQSLAKRLTQLSNQYFKENFKPGDKVGYQVPYDQQTSATTQLVLMTPGILLQHLLHDPTLEQVSCVILDEIHERSVNQDLAFAFLQDAIVLREDLQLLLMSATPDPNLQKQVTNRLFASGRVFPVTLDYLPAKKLSKGFEFIQDHLLRALQKIPDWQRQTCLVFLPGWKEIDRCRQLLKESWPDHKIFCLHSQVGYQEQQQALDAAQGARIILSTNIAETSLTIPDITLVIDSGLARRVNYEQSTGLSNLRTGLISRASADQRRGRAGRVRAGHCIRLWSEEIPLAAADLPEIRATDYLPLVLKLAHWGCSAEQLNWIEKPNRFAVDFAQQQLLKMGFVDQDYKITYQGKKVTELGTDPRVAALLLSQTNTISEELILLALFLHFEKSVQLHDKDWLSYARNQRQKNQHWQLQQKRWLTRLDLSLSPDSMSTEGLAIAFSDRIGFKQTSGKYRLNSGISVESHELLNSDWAVFPLIDVMGSVNRGLGFALQINSSTQKQLSQLEKSLIFKKQWCVHKRWLMGSVCIDEIIQPLSSTELIPLLTEHLRQLANEKTLLGLDWSDTASSFLKRAQILQEKNLLSLPSLSETDLIANLDKWLSPFLTSETSPESLPWFEALQFYLGRDLCEKINKLIPPFIELPSGRRVPVLINEHHQVIVSAKLQEFFGCESLVLGDSSLPLQIQLLSPNGSPLAITTDLSSFWKQSYPEVCKEMRGRYPRHPWPDDPLAHQATALTKKKLQQSL